MPSQVSLPCFDPAAPAVTRETEGPVSVPTLIIRERKRVPQRLASASVETLDDAHPGIQLRRQE
jgi:hypothetical protein